MGLLVQINWRPHTETPPHDVCSVLIGYPGTAECEFPLLGGIYIFQKGEFRSEEHDTPPSEMPFFWVLEQDVVEGLPVYGETP
jgi:hypothetical protein